MTEERLLECAIGVRMACSNPDVAGREAGQAVLVLTDRSGPALDLVGNETRFLDKVRQLGARPAYIPAAATIEVVAASLATCIGESGQIPPVVGIGDAGIFLVGKNRANAACLRAALLGDGSYEEAEDESPGRAKGCVAVVTGGAQGFGKGIAEELIREGACVVVADLNDKVGQATADELDDLAGSGNALFCHVDVTDLASIRTCIDEAVLAFGGVDLFVSNAGVLKAGGLDEMDEASFDLVTSVNYKAYFLGTKAVAPIMKRQHQLNSHHRMDIIQINSKSGLVGSKNNFAYAGSKFGCIGLTQSFALELMPFNICVNSICPGNYFDGPLWSDPENGLFVQYLKAGKVPGAKTVEDVRDHYFSRVPMGRGCLPKDVAKAIFYVREQRYETGQAIPVAGGEVMLR